MPASGRATNWRSWLALAVVIGGAVTLFVVGQGRVTSSVAGASLAYDRGDWESAAALAMARLKQAPDDRRALQILARSAARRRKDESARALFDRLERSGRLEAEDLFLSGAVLTRQGEPEKARERWEAGLRLDPNNPEILHEITVRALRGKQFVAAAETARRLAARPGWEVRGDLLLGWIEYEQDNPAEAVNGLRRALERDPSARGAPASADRYQRLLARALLRLGRHEEAQRELRAILSAGPDAETSWLLSRAALQAGAAAEANAALEKSGNYRDEYPLMPEPALYVGAARCGECHAATHRAQQHSRHARTFPRGDGLAGLPLPHHPLPDPARPDVRHELVRRERALEYDVRDRDTLYRVAVELAFGSGQNGVTLVGRDESGRSRELRMSYYADGHVWDLTTGQPSDPPVDEGYLGRVLSADDVVGCLSCHTTVARAVQEPNPPESADRGIGCERCHGPGGNHIQAIALKFDDPAIAKPDPGAADQVLALCGQCHNPLAHEVKADDPLAPRFPATTLTWSRCYTESEGALDCLTCHNPHHDSTTAPSLYEAKCLSCHGSKDPGRSSKSAVSCPVNPNQGCLLCHMPAVKTMVPHMTFTDHNIRVHRSTDQASLK